MDYNEWYRDDDLQWEDDLEEEILEEEADEDDYISDEDLRLFFHKISNEADFFSGKGIERKDYQHKQESLDLFRQGVDQLLKEMEGSGVNPREVLISEIKAIVDKCETFLLQRRINGCLKYSGKRIIIPGDLPYLSRDEYAKVVRLMTEGNAVIDLVSQPVDYMSACALLDAAMPSTMNLNLVEQFSMLPFFLKETVTAPVVFPPYIKHLTLGAKYYIDAQDKLQQKKQISSLSSLMMSAYFQNPEGKHALQDKLRQIRRKTLLAPQIFEYPTFHPKGELLQGYAFFTGIGRCQNEHIAFEIFKRMADQDLVQAQYTLGMCYFHGYGTKVSIRQGYKWIKKAHEGGNVGATYELALCYLYGRGIKRNPKKMLALLSPFIEKEEQFASFIGSLCYGYGIGAVQNQELSEKLYRIAKSPSIDDFGEPLRDALYELLDC